VHVRRTLTAVVLLTVTVAVVIVTVTGVGVASGPAGAHPGLPAGAQSPPSSASTTTLPEPAPGVPGQIIPEPGSGEEPEDPGDRGGWLQLTVLGLVLGGLGVIVGFVVRDARRRRDRGAAPGAE
jgi:hypothetical protein